MDKWTVVWVSWQPRSAHLGGGGRRIRVKAVKIRDGGEHTSHSLIESPENVLGGVGQQPSGEVSDGQKS